MILMKTNLPTDNRITIYESSDGKARVEVRFYGENVWLSQKLMAELFDTTAANVNMHLKNIYKEREIDKTSTIKEFLIVQKEGGRKISRKVDFYSLEAIISVGYRVNTTRGTEFRAWAIDKLKNYILKGWAIDKDRFIKGTKFDTRYFDELLEEIREIRASERMSYQKITDIFTTAIDYSPETAAADQFFAAVQNKLHFAITGNTAAEIIAQRADKNKSNMGLTSWRKSPRGKILQSDVSIAKNYLRKNELKQLNQIVSMYLDYAELQASRGRSMTMHDWRDKLEAFIKFNEREILRDKGKISHEAAQSLAEKEYEIFRIKQDKNYVSDFDKIVKQLKIKKRK